MKFIDNLIKKSSVYSELVYKHEQLSIAQSEAARNLSKAENSLIEYKFNELKNKVSADGICVLPLNSIETFNQIKVICSCYPKLKQYESPLFLSHARNKIIVGWLSGGRNRPVNHPKFVLDLYKYAGIVIDGSFDK